MFNPHPDKNPFWFEIQELRQLDNKTYGQVLIAKAEVERIYTNICKEFGLNSFLPIDTNIFVNDKKLGNTMAGVHTSGIHARFGRVHLIGISITALRYCWESVLYQTIPHEVGHAFIEEFDPKTNRVAPHGQLFMEVMDYLKAPRSVIFSVSIPVEDYNQYMIDDFQYFSQIGK